jgi:hypothetical protein
LKETIKKVSKERREICNACEWCSTNRKTVRFDVHCTRCGCPLDAKTKCLSCKCPLEEPKWDALTTVEVNDEIKQELYGQDDV